jgi:hypothetical protein
LVAAIVEPLCTQWVYERAHSLALGDMNLCVDNWLQISSYVYKVLPIAIVLLYKHISFFMEIILLGIRK